MNRLLLYNFLASCCLFFAVSFVNAQVSPLLMHGHAHNDYVHSRPLFEALENGFTSIEIDVYLHNGELKVSHLPLDLNGKKNIEELYLSPIQKVIAENGGSAYKGFSTPVIFMIDFKTDGIETYNALEKILKNYQSIITVYKNDSVIHQRAINILISGRSPESVLLKEDSALATIDESVQNMDDAKTAKVSTRYSSAWESYFTWKGNGHISDNQKAKLDSLVAKAHAMKKQIRFYHIPDKPKAWKVLLDAKVDWINTNKLAAFRKFCLQRKE